MKNIWKSAALMVCALSLAACSEEMPNNNSNEQDNASAGIEQVGENEYIVTVGSTTVSVDDQSRAITDQYMFDDTYDPELLYMHSTNADNAKVLTFRLGENKSFSFRLRLDEDGSFAVSSDLESVIGTTENYMECESNEEVYFSSWLTDVWENTVYSEAGTVMIKGETADQWSVDKLDVMYLQDRTDNENWREMYRSQLTYNGSTLQLLGQSSAIGAKVTMKRIVAAFLNSVIFKDYTPSGNTWNPDNVKENWAKVITDERGNSSEDWSVVLYLGEFPTSYNLRTMANGDGKAYYASSNNQMKDFGVAGYTVGGIVTDGTSTGAAYYGLGLVTNMEYLCTPVVKDEASQPLKAYVVVKCKGLPDGANRSCTTIEEFEITRPAGTGACYAKPNVVNHLITLFDVRDLAKDFGLEYVDENGETVAATTPVSSQSAGSRSSDGGFRKSNLKPREVIWNIVR